MKIPFRNFTYISRIPGGSVISHYISPCSHIGDISFYKDMIETIFRKFNACNFISMNFIFDKIIVLKSTGISISYLIYLYYFFFSTSFV